MTAEARTLDDLLTRRTAPRLRTVAMIVMGSIAFFIGWSSLAQLDEVATAEGEVAPQGKIKVVQHLEGGLIVDIFVQEGAEVRQGDALMLLDLGVGGVNRREMQVRLDALELTRARLLAEANDAPLAFPATESERQPGLVQAEQEAYEARRQELVSTINVLTEQVRQKESEVRELQARQRAVENNLRLARQKLEMSASLLQEGLTAKMDHVALQYEVEQLTGELSTLRESIPRIQAALAEAQERQNEERLRFRREAREQLGQIELNIARTRELLLEADDQQLRTEIRSPIDGIVKNMRYNTIGGVVKAGEPIMDIVPSRADLVIEARLSPADRGYVHQGQKATVKISTYDFARYGGLDGEVVLVAPDSTTPDQGQPYFRVVVRPEKYHLGDDPDEFLITPGMTATVEIHTGTRSVMDYLVKPVLKLRHEAFRER